MLQGISLVVEELERRRSHLSSICVSSTEQVLQRTELSNAFLEQYNTVRSQLFTQNKNVYTYAYLCMIISCLL